MTCTVYKESDEMQPKMNHCFGSVYNDDLFWSFIVCIIILPAVHEPKSLNQ